MIPTLKPPAHYAKPDSTRSERDLGFLGSFLRFFFIFVRCIWDFWVFFDSKAALCHTEYIIRHQIKSGEIQTILQTIDFNVKGPQFGNEQAETWLENLGNRLKMSKNVR